MCGLDVSLQFIVTVASSMVNIDYITGRIAHQIAEHDRSGGLVRRWLEWVDRVVTIKTDIRPIPGGFETRIGLLYDMSNGQERSSRGTGVQTGRLTTLQR